MEHEAKSRRFIGSSRAFRVVATLLAVLAVLDCAPGPAARRASGAPELSPRLNPFVFFEEGSELFVGIDGRAAQYADGEIFPLGLGLANLSMGSLTFNREAFVLEAEDGSRYPVVSHQEFNRGYTRSPSDARLADSFLQILALRYQNFTFRRWNLFPFKGQNTPSANEIQLARRQWTHGYLYFPMPPSGIRGKEFSLLVDTPENSDTFVVRFSL